MKQSDTAPEIVLAVDPGRDKCGLAVVRADGRVVHKAVVPTQQIGDMVASLLRNHPRAVLVMGDRTAARDVAALLDEHTGITAVLVDEHRSTEHGRRRYFRDNPPRGWRRLLPLGLQTPPCPYDDYVAVVIAERYLESLRPR
ncbi:MAG TPA: pre-16S rRNA-processing nuclease YqgF [Armatimonadota bacterium]|nr:pre-16S rRNA-processing nuclease YqgF [Armatimonadota bacterium]